MGLLKMFMFAKALPNHVLVFFGFCFTRLHNTECVWICVLAVRINAIKCFHYHLNDFLYLCQIKYGTHDMSVNVHVVPEHLLDEVQ